VGPGNRVYPLAANPQKLGDLGHADEVVVHAPKSTVDM
jgi:hypothetical protein